MTWEQLVQQFYLQGMIGLGKLQNPVTQKTERNLELAKVSIEILALLEEKTQGNLTDQEKRILADALHILRINYALEKERQMQEKQAEQRSQEHPETDQKRDSEDSSGNEEEEQ